jgi:hypothetical protein
VLDNSDIPLNTVLSLLSKEPAKFPASTRVNSMLRKSVRTDVLQSSQNPTISVSPQRSPVFKHDKAHNQVMIQSMDTETKFHYLKKRKGALNVNNLKAKLA